MPHLLIAIPNLLGPLIGPLKGLLMGLTSALHSYGLAIILFTILVRAVLTPLNLKALRSQKRMQSLAPKIKELQQRHKGNREELGRAQMTLYKDEGINPASGCLPILIQLPILYALFGVFSSLAKTSARAAATHIYHDKFLWFFLDKPDHLFGALGGPLPILAGITQWIQSRMMLQPTSDPQQRATMQIMQFLPLMIILFAANYPAGLALYWVVTTVYAIALQYFITGWGQLFTSPFRIPEAVAVSGASSGGKAVSSKVVSSKAVFTPPTEAREGAAGAPSRKSGMNGHGTGADTIESDGRQGKMQRAAQRQNHKKTRSRSAKGAKR